MTRSYVVTGGGRGVGRAVTERLLRDGGSVVVVELDGQVTTWAQDHPAAARIAVVTGDAADQAASERAADVAEAAGQLTGWVNNAALDAAPAGDILALITANLRPALAGCGTAVQRFLASGTAGAIVNVSSHQAQRPVRGALPQATAKAATEGLTRALAVDYGHHGIRVNAVALGSIVTERHDALLSDEASFINGAILPVDGGRSALGQDPEQT